MTTRHYAAIRYDRMSAADLSLDAGLGGATELRLSLFGDGTFILRVASYYNDWGTRSQESTTFDGTYGETDAGVACHAARRTHRLRRVDRDWGDDEKSTHTDACDVTYVFLSRCGGLVSGFREHGMDGVVLAPGLEPVPPVFR